ncbi:MAG: glutamate racemase [Leptospiraceae bacterium]|nr:glutamate racemase [Leptospiraceae bacterium]MCP5512362.1 glutamate racemase [Leptospiraceae bacterium]
MTQRPLIGVMDSGFGGLSVLSEFQSMVSGVDFLYFGDLKNSPYGPKSKKEVLEHTEEIVNFFISEKCTSILLACNTATSAAAFDLRSRYSIPIFGMEPAIKPAVTENPDQKVAVFATSLTLREEKFNLLERSLGVGHVLEPINCDGLASLIDREDFSGIHEFLSPKLKDLHSQSINLFVLGCTHYLLVKPYFYEFDESLRIYDGNTGTIRHMIKSLNLNSGRDKSGSEIQIYLNGGGEQELEIAQRYLNSYNRDARNYVR